MKSLNVGTFSVCLLQYFDLAWVLNIFLVIVEPLLKYSLVYFFSLNINSNGTEVSHLPLQPTAQVPFLEVNS